VEWLERELVCSERLQLLLEWGFCLGAQLLISMKGIFVHEKKGETVTEISKFWRPRRHGRNVWLWIGTSVLILGVLKVNDILDIGAEFGQLMVFGILLTLFAFVEDLRYRFYRKFEQADDEAAGSSEVSSNQS